MLLAVAALMMSACSEDPIKKELASTVSSEVGYKFKSYTVTDTIHNADKVAEILSNYHFVEVVSRSDFEKWRGDLLKRAFENKAESDELGIEPSYIYKETMETVAMMDTVLAEWDNMGEYSLSYRIAESRYFDNMSFLLNAPGLREYSVDKYRLESSSGRQDFAALKELSVNPDAVFGYIVKHDYTVENPIVEGGKRIVMHDEVLLDSDMKAIEANHMALGE